MPHSAGHHLTKHVPNLPNSCGPPTLIKLCPEKTQLSDLRVDSCVSILNPVENSEQ